MKHRIWSVAAWGATTAMACGGEATVRPATPASLDAYAASPRVADAAQAFPELVREAQSLREQAQVKERAGDNETARWMRDVALAKFEFAVFSARKQRAEVARAAADRDMERDAKLLREYADARHQRERLLAETGADGPARVAPPDTTVPTKERLAARAIAARNLGFEAILLCDAAKSLGASEADAIVQGARDLVQAPSFEDAVRVRTECLSLLGRTRRLAKPTTDTASSLFAAVTAETRFDVSRDERGLVFLLRGPFDKERLTDAAKKDVEGIGAIAKAHPAYPIQVVVHRAAPAKPAEQAEDGTRAAVVRDALVAAGADKARVSTFAPQNAIPRVDPKLPDAKRQNARIEIVLVAPAN
jgi:hypothetical protein